MLPVAFVMLVYVPLAVVDRCHCKFTVAPAGVRVPAVRVALVCCVPVIAPIVNVPLEEDGEESLETWY